jgi:hypothetical protein
MRMLYDAAARASLPRDGIHARPCGTACHSALIKNRQPQSSR